MKKLMIRLASGTLYELKTDLTAGDLFTIDGLLGSTAYVVHDWNGEIAFTTPSESDWASFTTTGSPAAGTYTDGDGNWAFANWITPGEYSINVTQAGYVETVVIGGGGGGGRRRFSGGGGGGEAGQVIERKGAGKVWLPLGRYQVLVGAGGLGGRGDEGHATSGSRSAFGFAADGFGNLSSDAIEALGGGRGATDSGIGPIGGGGGAFASSGGMANALPGVTGFRGSNPASGQFGQLGGGGAGAGGNAINAIGGPVNADNRTGRGGIGVTINITGVPEQVAGGGHGGGFQNSQIFLTTHGWPENFGSPSNTRLQDDPTLNGAPGTGAGGPGASNAGSPVTVFNCNGGSGRIAIRTQVA